MCENGLLVGKSAPEDLCRRRRVSISLGYDPKQILPKTVTNEKKSSAEAIADIKTWPCLL